MQESSGEFKRLAQSSMRPISYGAFISFDKEFEEGTDFFTIETSLIGGTDFLKPNNATAVQLWDKYDYTDYSDRVLKIEWTKQVEQFASVTLQIADVTFDNHDNFFTPGAGSEIDEFILPFRPIRLFAGFGTELIPIFIGLTEKMPIIDDKNKTATFHCIDFLSSLLDTLLNEALLLQDNRTDQILTAVFEEAGLTSSQLDFDVALETIPFSYFRLGDKLKDGVLKLMQVEMGRLFMSELGTIQFRTRENFSEDPIYDFDFYDSIIDVATHKEDAIINVVEVRGAIREIQDNAQYWELIQAQEVGPGESIDVWADMEDPIVSVDDPEYIDSATTSSFQVNTQADGLGSANSTDVTLTSSSTFSSSFKMTFRNSGSSTLYITNITLWASVIAVVQEIYVREQLDDSVAKFDEKVLEIDNDFYQDEATARQQALIIINSFGEYGDILDLDVKGIPTLQLDDVVRVRLERNEWVNYKIIKIMDRILQPMQYKQTLRVKQFVPLEFFTIAVSLIGGTDRLKNN